MRFLLAFDKFRGSMTAIEACQAAAEGLAEVGIESIQCPLSDGGDGFVETVAVACEGSLETVKVLGPQRDPVVARVFFADPGPKAIIESAHACGLSLLSPEERNPELTTTYGVGQLIQYCDQKPCTMILMGIGGSATNDGGAGMLAALGWQFFDEDGKTFVPTGATLHKIAKIEKGPLLSTPITVASDVTNPLCGPQGAAYVFARQKGADDAMIERLDAGLRHFAEKMHEATGFDYSLAAGAGAAGGLGFGLMFLGGETRSGAEIVMKLVNFPIRLTKCDVCITGEGSFDAQSGMGKLPMVVAEHCRQSGVPCYLLAGVVQSGSSELPFAEIQSINTPGESLEHSLKNAKDNMRRSARELGLRLLEVSS
ncbi:MAG: glycerate kinase [Fimbriimonadaceae bacterium]|nr:glycerate kinase [Fimbriimonadaceae bacterium]